MASSTPRNGTSTLSSSRVRIRVTCSTYQMTKMVTASGIAAKIPARNVLRSGLLSCVMPVKYTDRPDMKKHSARGVLLVICLFLLGGLVVGGMFLAPRPKSPPAPAEATWGVPDRKLRFVSYNILHNQR